MNNANPQHNMPFHLILDEMEGNLSAEDAQQLEDWKKSSADHLKAYSELMALQDHLELLALRKQIDPEKAWKKFAPALSGRQDKAALKVIRLRNYYTWIGTAAVIIAVMFVVGLGFFTNEKTISTAKNEHKKVVLPDGSEIMMNERTTLSYNSREFLKNRVVKLIGGEAFFDVQHEEHHPFLIDAGEVNIRDIGTSFNLKMDTAQIVVVVNSGEVALENPDLNNKLFLSENERGTFDRKTKRMTASKNTDINYKSWFDQKLSFTQTPLSEVADHLYSAFGTVIIFQDPELKNRKLTAYFNHQSEDQIMEIITATLQLQVKKKGRNFVLYK